MPAMDEDAVDSGCPAVSFLDGKARKLLLEYERMIVAFSSLPRGAEAEAAAKVLKERPSGSEPSRIVLQARALLKVYGFYVSAAARRAGKQQLAEQAMKERAKTRPILTPAEMVAMVARYEAAEAERKAAECAVKASAPDPLMAAWSSRIRLPTATYRSHGRPGELRCQLCWTLNSSPHQPCEPR